MRDAVLSLAALCMFTALFEQLMRNRSAVAALHAALGVEIFRMLLAAVGGIVDKFF